MDRPTARRQTGTPAAYGKHPDGSAEAVPQVREGDPPHRGGRALPGGDARRCWQEHSAQDNVAAGAAAGSSGKPDTLAPESP